MYRNTILADLSEKYDSFYFYDEQSIISQTALLKEAFPSVNFLYSLKSNPHHHVVRSVVENGFGADAASLEEVRLAGRCGLLPEHIYYSAPGKTEGDIAAALSEAVLIADSLFEVMRIDCLARERGMVAEIGLRIHPRFDGDGHGTPPSKFGIDENDVIDFLNRHPCRNVKVVGIHVHMRSQILDARVLYRHYRNMLFLAEKVLRFCADLRFVNLGSGIGIPYGADDAFLDVRALGADLTPCFESFCNAYPQIALLMESGRFVVGKCGLYVTKVLDRKVSGGKRFLILNNTLNGFLRPALARLFAAFPDAPAAEPLFTSKNAFPCYSLKEGAPEERVTLAGNLCTSADIIAEDVLLPRLDVGDVVIIPNAGSYGASLSPVNFSSMRPPAEIFYTKNGKILE